MPHPHKGIRYGGRQKGSRNKTTLARAAAQVEIAKQTNQKLGLDIMIEIMNHFAGLGARYQPKFDDKEIDGKTVKVQISGDEKKSSHYLELAATIAKDVARYQTPMLQSTTIRHDAPEAPIKVQIEIV